jgi:hypothetical protein
MNGRFRWRGFRPGSFAAPQLPEANPDEAVSQQQDHNEDYGALDQQFALGDELRDLAETIEGECADDCAGEGTDPSEQDDQQGLR